MAQYTPPIITLCNVKEGVAISHHFVLSCNCLVAILWPFTGVLMAIFYILDASRKVWMCVSWHFECVSQLLWGFMIILWQFVIVSWHLAICFKALLSCYYILDPVFMLSVHAVNDSKRKFSSASNSQLQRILLLTNTYEWS